MNKRICLPAILIGLLLTGCSMLQGPVPKNSIKITGPSGNYQIETPKNVSITGFQARIETNGVLSITFSNWCSTNDAMVIDKAGAARVMEIQAWASLLQAITETAIKAAAKP